MRRWRRFFKDGGLFEFVDTPEPAFKELIMEFLCTFSENKDVEADDEPRRYLLRMFGMNKSILLNEFNKCLGILVEFMESEEYTTILKERPSDFDVEKFWVELSRNDD